MTMPRQQITVVRHGETEWSATGQHTGHTDIELTARGRESAERTGRMLRSEQFDRVWTSPLRRAHDTCALAGYADGATVHDELMEWDYGEYEGLTRAEIVERATGGFTNSPLWLQLVADILEIPLALPRVSEATAFGAGLLGMIALGMLDGLDAVDDLIVVTEELAPGTDDLAVHRAAHERYAELVEVLSDPFDRLAADRMGGGAGQ